MLAAFFEGLPRRLPKGTGELAVAVRTSVKSRLAELNAEMLGREVDHRVPVDIDAMTQMICSRIARFGSIEWARHGDTVRQAIGGLSADLRAFDVEVEGDDDEDTSGEAWE